MIESHEAQLIRRYVDDDLPVAEREAFEQRIAEQPELKQAIDAERSLRQHVAKILEQPPQPMPADLQQRVAAALAGAAVMETESESRTDAATISREATPVEDQEHDGIVARLFTGPTRANGWMVAATLLIVSAAVLVGIFGPSINEVAPPLEPQTASQEIAAFANSEHMECATDPEHLYQHVSATDELIAAEQLQKTISPEVIVFDLSAAGYEFVGAGLCRVPHSDRAAHMFYRKSTSKGSHGMVTIHVLPDSGQCGACKQKRRLGQPGTAGHRWFTLRRVSASRSPLPVFGTVDSELLYIMVCCNDRDDVIVRQTMDDQLQRN